MDDFSYSRDRVHTSSKEWRIILRNEDSRQIVLYNKDNSELSVQDMDVHQQRPAIERKYSNICIYCGQTLPGNATDRHAEPGGKKSLDADQFSQSFMDTNYFKLLGQSTFQNQYYQPIEGSFPSNTESESFNIYLSKEIFNQGYYQKFFREQQKLGKGFRGSVFLCRHVLDDIELGNYAVKKVPVGDNHDWLVRMLKEVNTLERLHHPNIIDYKHAWLEYHQLTIFGPEIPVLFILMELANGGNLETFVMNARQSVDTSDNMVSTRPRKQSRSPEPEKTKRNAFLSLSTIKELFYDICQGLLHLHAHGILHRDLKPSNLLLQYKGDDPHEIPTILISDFGECDGLESSSDESARTGGTGTLEFMAPELLHRNERNEFTGSHSKSSDVWSLGMILYFMTYGSLPFTEKEDDDLIRLEIFHLDQIHFPLYDGNDAARSKSIIKTFQNIITRCLTRRPTDRPTVAELLILLNSSSPSFSLRQPQTNRRRSPTSTSMALPSPQLLATSSSLKTATSHTSPDLFLLGAPTSFNFDRMREWSRSRKLFQFNLIFAKILLALYIFPAHAHWILGSIIFDIFMESKRWRIYLLLMHVLFIFIFNRLQSK